MFERVDGPAVPSGGDVRAAVLARLARIMPSRPAGGGEGPIGRAVELSPGVYAAPGRRPLGLSRDGVGTRAHAAVQPGIDAGGSPGPVLAAGLDRIEPGALSSQDLLDAVAESEQLISWGHARQCELVAEFARRRPGPYAPDEPGRRVSEFAADEIAARLRVTRRAADLKLGLALDLADRLPATHQALDEGRIDVAKARAIADLTGNLDDPQHRRTVEERVLRRAGSQTVPELRRCLLRAVAGIDPAASARRRAKAEAGRFLRVHPCSDGMAEIHVLLPAEDAMTIFTAVDAFAREADPDDLRPIAARRVDALVDMCRQALNTAATAESSAGAEPWAGDAATGAAGRGGDDGAAGSGTDRRSRRRAARRRRRRDGPRIQVTVAASTLLGFDDRPGELAGHGSIPAEVARRISADPDATWRRLLTDPMSGVLLDYGTRVYRPPPSLARHVRARDQVCCFPGCRQPAEYCDLDHGLPYPHGPTSEANLLPLCRHHHRAKTEGGWSWRRNHDHTITWTAPTGHPYQVSTPPILDGIDYPVGQHRRGSKATDPADDPPPF